MADARWQVQHVARFKGHGFFAFPATEDAQGCAFYPGRGLVAAATKGPAAMTLCLQQEHIILIVVRPYAAAFGRITGHNVVKTPVRHKTKMLKQVGDLRDPVV